MNVAVLKETNGAQEGQFSLIHIPLSLYSCLLQPLLQLFLPWEGAEDGTQTHSSSSRGKHEFLNISITPMECSVVCLSSCAQEVFAPRIANLSPSDSARIHISRQTYNVFSVNSAGVDAGQRVMDLTAPLALAGIPIFFITTYYTDFILVPSKDRSIVGRALLARGFDFSEDDSAYVSPTTSTSTRRSSGSTTATSEAPSTPPPVDVDELQSRTFRQLKKCHVNPFIETDLHIVQVSGKESSEDGFARASSRGYTNHSAHSWLNRIDPSLYLGLVSALVQQPRFLSLTLSQDDAPSILIDKTLIRGFGDSIVGDLDAELVPIFLDLVNLPLQSTGIVCGVAGRLVEEMGKREFVGNYASELSYLSTARAGAVMLSREGVETALAMLRGVLGDVA